MAYTLKYTCKCKILYTALWALLLVICQSLKYCAMWLKVNFCSMTFYTFLILWCVYFCEVHRVLKFLKCFLVNYPLMFMHAYLWWTFFLIFIHNPKLLNTSPRSRASAVRQNPLIVFRWNPNSILAHNGIRIRWIEALN